MGDAVMDTELIQAFIAPRKENLDIFADAQWLQMPDQNNGAYNNGRLFFSTTNLRTQFVDYHNAYLEIQLVVSVSTTPAIQFTNGGANTTLGYLGAPVATTWSTTIPPNVCFKSSVLDLIPGIQHSTDTGTSIINELVGLDQMNAWRMNVEHNTEWADEFGPALCYAPDSFPNSDLMQGTNSGATVASGHRDPSTQPGIAAVTNLAPIITVANPAVTNMPLTALTSPYNEFTQGATATGSSTTNPNQAGSAAGYQIQRNPYFNAGFKKRCDYFRQACDTVVYNTTLSQWQFSGRFLVPLKYLHDFWMQDQAPKINIAYSTNFQIPWANALNTFNNPFMTDGLCGNPIITPLGTAAASGAMGTPSGNMFLYYRSVTFGPEDNKRIVAQITDGTWQTVDYIITQTPPSIPIAVGATPINQSLTQSVAAPLRIVGFFMTPNSLISNVLGNQTSYVRLSGFNIMINNTPLYKNSLQFDNEFWQIMSEQFDPNTGSVITYKDYTFNLRTIVGDLQRLGERLPSPNAPVSIQVVGIRNDTYGTVTSPSTVTLTMQWYIESRQTIKYKINTASTDVIVGLVNSSK